MTSDLPEPHEIPGACSLRVVQAEEKPWREKNKGLVRLSRAVALAGEPPCDSCAWRRACRDELLACEVFARYINSESRKRSKSRPRRIPTRQIFWRVFRANDAE